MDMKHILTDSIYLGVLGLDLIFKPAVLYRGWKARKCSKP